MRSERVDWDMSKKIRCQFFFEQNRKIFFWDQKNSKKWKIWDFENFDFFKISKKNSHKILFDFARKKLTSKCFWCFLLYRRNFPRNPKMILRKPCGQPTDRVAGIPETTDPKRSFFFRMWKIPWYFCNQLSGGSL